MDLAIVQRLVCPRPHETAPLVVRADFAEHGHMQRGVLGCPVCGMEWSITNGIAEFGPRLDAGDDPPIDAIAVAACLSLTEPKLILTDGLPTAINVALVREYGASVVALDSDTPPETATVIDGAAIVPLAEGIANGVALFRPRDAAFIASAVKSLATDGRLVATSSIELPAGVREIARNGVMWVAEREAAVVPVTLRRR